MGQSIDSLAVHYLRNVTDEFRGLKTLADKAIAQVDDQEFFQNIDANANSIALIMKHMAGNMRSRWTDFLTTDGEKPDRDRDAEFVNEDHNRNAMTDKWEAGWTCLFEALGPLTPEDLSRTVFIRSQPQTVVEAINRQLTHYGLHVGQIVFLAKHFKSNAWQTLSIARNRSSAFNTKRMGISSV